MSLYFYICVLLPSVTSGIVTIAKFLLIISAPVGLKVS